jgi:pimeloyl-ACP methyl ester carboxylesterase
LRLMSWLVALLLSVAGLTAAHADDAGRFVNLGAMQAAPVPPTRITVWLPPGYNTTKRRYGVVYMHDGQNLFDRKRSNSDKVWGADESALRLIASGKVDPFIIVGIDQPGAARSRQYMPQRVYADVADPTRKRLDAFANGAVYSDAYLAFIVKTLKPKIDHEFRTLRDRSHTSIVGSSMGGLISFYAIAQYPDVFGSAGGVSTHWPMGSPVALVEPIPDILAAWDRYLAGTVGAPQGRRVWFDHGTKTLDSYYAPYQQAIDARLVALSWQKGRDFESRVYEGTAHEENAWAARLDDVFGWLLAGRK